MPTERLSRNAQVLRYLLEVAPGIGHTKLLKFAYLADLEGRRHLGRPISEFCYVRFDHGPFDKAFYSAKAELLGSGLATDETVLVGSYEAHSLRPTQVAVEYDFSVAEAEVLSFVAGTYLDQSAAQLCEDVVYQTPPMKGATVGEELNMDQVNKLTDDPLGFTVERMLAGEESGRAGRTRPMRDVLNELRARYH